MWKAKYNIIHNGKVRGKNSWNSEKGTKRIWKPAGSDLQIPNSRFGHNNAPYVRSISPVIIISRPSSKHTDIGEIATRKLRTTGLDRNYKW